MSDFIIVSSAAKSIRIPVCSIVRLESCHDHAIIIMKDGKQYVYSHHLKVLLEKLDPRMFFRAHNGHVINMNEIVTIEWNRGAIVTMTDGSTVPVSYRRKSDFRSVLDL